MTIEARINKELWDDVSRSYSEGRFKDAINDAVLHLTDVIRDKSGLDGDGVSLVGSAFGGGNPKIKVNKLETKSDKDEQSGLEAILRGMYTSIRNPRHHGKKVDTVKEADAIILFVDYLLGVIGRAKAQFSMTETLKMIFDDAFVASEKYAGLVVEEIPEKYRFDVFIEAFRGLSNGNGEKLSYFFEALFRCFDEEKQKDATKIISSALRSASAKSGLIPILRILRIEDWSKLDQIARMRVESLMLESIKEGEYSQRKRECTQGVLGTWADRFASHFELRKELFRELVRRLTSENRNSRAYVCQYFTGTLASLEQVPDDWVVQRINGALKDGKQEVFDYISGMESFPNENEEKWAPHFRAAIEEFKPRQELIDIDEDLPF